MAAAEIDAIILSVADAQWRKVALTVAKAQRECADRAISANYDDIGQRIAAVVKMHVLEARGDVSNWRESEICLPA